mmetsp:Transcript_7252/g.16918  ORF Transcript_7252/g.16918 Transcript_7252/m.16918 type:complete len:202 (-) Transcript_7252:613-1218(-)
MKRLIACSLVHFEDHALARGQAFLLLPLHLLGRAEAVRVLALPVPGVGDGGGHVDLGHPIELLLGLLGLGIASGDVASAARGDLVLDGLAARLLHGGDDLQHRGPVASAQVVGDGALANALDGLVNGLDVATGEVDNVNVVAHACAIGGVVVAAEDRDLLEAAHGDLRDVRHEIVGQALGVLADEAARVATNGVEVAQQLD